MTSLSQCADAGYTRFAFSYAPSPQAAFEKECRNYEDLGRRNGLDHRIEPVPPAIDLESLAF
jgi:hypothetical protein